MIVMGWFSILEEKEIIELGFEEYVVSFKGLLDEENFREKKYGDLNRFV